MFICLTTIPLKIKYTRHKVYLTREHFRAMIFYDIRTNLIPQKYIVPMYNALTDIAS